MRTFQLFAHTYPITCLILYSLAALLVGSVLSMLIYRLPIMLMQAETQESQTPSSYPFNLFLPRSHCVRCKKTIPIYHNIPLLSYLLLGGRCHHCHHAIAWRYPLVEASTLLLSLVAVYVFGYHLILVAVLPFIWICIALTMIDIEHQLLPDTLTYSLLWLGLLVNTQTIFCSLPNAVWSAAIAYLSLWLIIKLFYLCTGKIGMGNGDFKLFAALAAWFGWTALTPILLMACMLGIIIGSLYLWHQKKNRHHAIPFGPYLCIAGLSYLFLPMLKQF